MLIRWFPLFCIPSSLCIFLYNLDYSLVPLVSFSGKLLYSSALIGLFLKFLILFWSSLCSLSLFLLLKSVLIYFSFWYFWHSFLCIKSVSHCNFQLWFFLLSIFLIGVILLYNVVLVASIYQCKLAIIIHISPPSWSPSQHRIPSRSSQITRPGSLCYIATSQQLSILHLMVCIYVKTTFSIHHNVSFHHCVHKSIFHICVSIPSLQIGSSMPYF